MAVTSGFYNSLNGDRKYNADQISAIFNGIIKDGIFSSIGTAFIVKAGTGNTVNVGIGRAWFNNTWIYNDAVLPVTLDSSELILNRIDAVILEIDRSNDVRDSSVKFVKGTPASSPQNPSMISTEYVHQYPLAFIRRNAGSSSITQSDITNMVGTSSCPFVTGILETIDIDDLIAKWESQWTDFQNESEQDFTEWFEQVKGQLGTDPAGHLQNQINEIAPHVSYQYKGFFEAENWSEYSGTYTQTVSLTAVNGGPSISSSSSFTSPPMCKASTDENTNEILLDNLTIFNQGYAVLGANQVTVTVFEKPSSDMEIIWNIEEGA